MGEIVIMRMNSAYEVEFYASEEEHAEPPKLQPAHAIASLTPYGLMLASLISCTGVVLHTFAEHHGVQLHVVEVKAHYDRAFKRDCEHCEEGKEFTEGITQEIALFGHLTALDRKKLLKAADYCPIHKILTGGIRIETTLVVEGVVLMPAKPQHAPAPTHKVS